MHHVRRSVLRSCPAIAIGFLLSCSGGGTQTAPPKEAAVTADSEALRSRAPTLTTQNSGTTNGLIGISPVSSRVVWASGRNGTFLKTTDGGATWHAGVVAGAEALQFRDVQGVSDKVAFLLSIGNGTDSRIYKTVDGGESWTLEFQNQDPARFYDCFAFWGSRAGVTMADSVDGRFPVVRTLDGATWQDIGDRLPAALPGESGFAASGTCAATEGRRRAWLITGGAERARVLATTDRGHTWAAHDTPLGAGPSGGGFSIAFRDSKHGIVAGGDLDPAVTVTANFARSRDGGKTWQLGPLVPVPGAVYGIAYAMDREHDDGDHDDRDDDDRDRDHGEDHHSVRLVATAPTATTWSSDEGATWKTFDGVTGFWAVAFANERTGWLVGTDGRIVRIDF
jgi:photosystem II stability/assembly factor-like uncharacterized protein